MGENVAPKFLFLITLFVAVCMGNDVFPAVIDGQAKSSIGCIRTTKTYPVTQSDSKGNSCSDTITVNVCRGLCDSKEISDWKFPFKKSHHPVCVPLGRTKATVMLSNCDPEAALEARKYDYLEPIACSCQICSTIDTSCESPLALTRGGSIRKLIGTDTEIDYSFSDKN